MSTDGKMIQIVKALAAHLAQQNFSFAVAEVIAGSFEVVDLDDHGTEPKIYVTVGAVTEFEEFGSTRESKMFQFAPAVQIVDYTQFASAQELADLSKLSQEVRQAIDKQVMAGAEYWSTNNEQPVDDFVENELETGLYYRQVFTVEYLDTEQ